MVGGFVDYPDLLYSFAVPSNAGMGISTVTGSDPKGSYIWAYNTVSNIWQMYDALTGIIIYETTNGGSLPFANFAGIVNAYTALVPGLTLTNGAIFEGRVNITNTLAGVTLNVNSFGAIPVLNQSGDPIAAGDLEMDIIYVFIYDITLNAWLEAGLGAGSVPTLIGNVAIVDGVNGVDLTAVVGSWAKTFKTVQAAVTAAIAGQSVLVLPGVYAETVTLKAGVLVQGFGAASEISWGVDVPNIAGAYRVENIKIARSTAFPLVTTAAGGEIINISFNNVTFTQKAVATDIFKWNNTAPTSRLNVTGGSLRLSTASGKYFNSSLGTAGIVSFFDIFTELSVPDANTFIIAGDVNASFYNSQLNGIVTVADTAILMSFGSTWTAALATLITTTSSGLTSVVNSTLKTAVVGFVVGGGGAFFYSNLSFNGGTSAFDPALNAAAGAKVFPTAALALVPEALVGFVSGRLNFDGSKLQFQVGGATTRLTKQALGGNTGILGAPPHIIADPRVAPGDIIVASYETYGPGSSFLAVPSAAIAPGLFTLMGASAGDSVNYIILTPGV